jgi:succinoglycan biosynthesis transport protein ExoP
VNLTDLLRRWWPLLLVATLLAAGVGLAASTQMTTRYEATTQLLVGPVSADFDTGRAAATNVVTYGELATTEPVLRSTMDQLGITMSSRDFRDRVEVDANSMSRIITITVTDPDPARAAAIAETLGAELQALAPAEDEAAGGSLSVISPAVAAEDPVPPTPPMVVVLSALGGLSAAVLAALVFDSRSREERSSAPRRHRAVGAAHDTSRT